LKSECASASSAEVVIAFVPRSASFIVFARQQPSTILWTIQQSPFEMAIDGISPAAVVFPLANFAMRGVHTAYEFASVPAETNDYLKTIRQVLDDLKTARDLRRQKSLHLSVKELNRVDRVIKNTEEAMAGLEVLVERARVDMAIGFNRVGACSRMLWVMRDSNKVAAAMSRLDIACQSLHGEISMLRFAHKGSSVFAEDDNDCKRLSSGYGTTVGDGGHGPAPPSYLQATIDSMHERRLLHRLSSARKQSTTYSGHLSLPEQDPIMHSRCSGDADGLSASVDNIGRYIRHNEEMLSVFAPDVPASRETRSALFVSMAQPDATRGNISELYGDSPSASLSVPAARDQPTPFSVPKTPSISQQLESLSLKPAPARQTRRTTPHVVKPRNASKRRASSSTSLMGSTARMPGHRKACEVRWYDAVDSTDHREQASAVYEGVTVAATAEEVSPLRTVDGAMSGSDEATEQVLGRTQTRRRPPRLPLNSVVSPNESQVSANPQNVGMRSTRSRPSRLDWQVQEHLAKIAALRSRTSK